MEIEPSNTQEKPGFISRGSGWFKAKAIDVVKKTKKVGQDDPRRIIHSLKVGLALTLVSLFYYFRPLYDGFGSAGMWAVLTVVVVFEFTVGATLSKSMNRGFATLLAGALGVGANFMASRLGDEGEPILLAILVFLLTAASTFARFIPKIKARYDYGVLIFILTFSLVSVSGYRVDKILELAHQRLSTILLGAAICMIISIFLCPVWAGEDLHNLISSNLNKIASFLEGFGGEYFKVCGNGDSGMVTKEDDKSFLQGYKSVLNTKTTEESLANFAWWEPGHGNFRFNHPWKQYLKIGLLIRKCAFHFEALSCYLNSEIEAPPEFLRKFQEPCRKMSSESSKALKELSTAIKTTTHPASADIHIHNSKIAIADLKTSLEAASGERPELLRIISAVTVASILTDIAKCIEEIAESVCELSHQANFKSGEEGNVSPEKPQAIRRGSVKPVTDVDGDGVGGGGDSDGGCDHVVLTVHGVASSELPGSENSHVPKS